MRTDIRDNTRVMATISDASLALLQQRIARFIDSEVEVGGYKWHALEGARGLNERLRFYKCACLVIRFSFSQPDDMNISVRYPISIGTLRIIGSPNGPYFLLFAQTTPDRNSNPISTAASRAMTPNQVSSHLSST